MQIRYWNNADFPGKDIDTSVQSTLDLCMDHCLANSGCQAFTYDPQNRYVVSHNVNCWIKSKAENYNMNFDGLTSGMRCSHAPADNPPMAWDGQYRSKIFYCDFDLF